MRVLFVQYTGDYLSAYRLLENSKTEIYYGHRYVLDTLADLAASAEEVAILCCLSATAHDERLPTGVRVAATGAQKKWDNPKAWEFIRSFAPTHLVVLGPLPGAIRWGIENGCEVLCILADSFEINPIRRFVRYGRLPSLLNHRRVAWVGNHGINSCLSLRNYGVAPNKILPWDWPHTRSPQDSNVKRSAGAGPWKLFFAGLVTERKGIRDVIAAVALLKRRGIPVTARMAGSGEIEKYRVVAQQHGVEAEVEFLGAIPNPSVVEHMRAASIVLVPSQHGYPEGLPLTIYEALCARTPIVASDHPMFLRRLVDGKSALIYRSGRANELADAIERLLKDHALYEHISAASQLTWDGLQLPVKWGDLIKRWLDGQEEDWRWLHDHRLDSGRYEY